MMLNEGWDCPGVDLVVLGRTTESEIVFAQQVRERPLTKPQRFTETFEAISGEHRSVRCVAMCREA